MIFIKDYLPPVLPDVTVTDAFEHAILDAQDLPAPPGNEEEQILVLENRKEYTIERTLDVKGLTILGNGSKLIFDFDQPNPPIYQTGLIAEGNKGTDRLLNTTAVKGTNFVECSAISVDGLETGDLVIVYSDKIAGANIRMGETKRVKKYENNKVYFDDYLFDTYELGTGSNAKVAKIDPAKLKVYNLEIEYTDTDTVSVYTDGIQVFYGDNVVISGVKFNNAKRIAMALYSCHKLLVDNCEVDNSNLASLGYGVMIGNGCSYPTVRDSRFLGMRHAIRTGGSSLPGAQWEVLLENIVGDNTSTDRAATVFELEATVGSIKIKNCTAIGGLKYINTNGTEIEYTDWVAMSYAQNSIVAYKNTEGIYKLYIAGAGVVATDIPGTSSKWNRFGYSNSGIGIRMKGDVLIENFRAIGLNWGIRTGPVDTGFPNDSSRTDKANLIIKNMYAEDVRYPVLMGGLTASTHILDSLTIDGLTATSYKDSEDNFLPAIQIQQVTINKWSFNNIRCYNKRMMKISDEDAGKEGQTLPKELVINNSSLTFSGEYSVTADSTYLLDLVDALGTYLPVETIIFNNLKTDGSVLFFVPSYTDGSQENLYFMFNNCVFANIPSGKVGFENVGTMRGIEFNNCVYETNGERLIDLGANVDYVGLSNNTFIGSQMASLINNPSGRLDTLFHSGNYLNGNALINNPPPPPNNKEYGDT